jgi:DNA repair protein RecO (recombination protein O)
VKRGFLQLAASAYPPEGATESPSRTQDSIWMLETKRVKLPTVSRYRTRSGIVLRRSVTPAGDVILSLFTPEGKQRMVARSGVKGSRSTRLNLFQHLTLQTYDRPGNVLSTITQVQLEGALSGLTNPSRYPYAHLLSEMADRVWQENDFVGQAGFELFSGGLRGLARHHDPDRVALVITWKMLALHGLYPRVHRCLETGDETGLTHFDPVAGSVLSSRAARGLRLGEHAIEELQRMAYGTVREVLEAEISPETRKALWHALEAYTRVQLGEIHAWNALRLAQEQDITLELQP